MSRFLLQDPQFLLLQHDVLHKAEKEKLKEGEKLVAYWETVEAQPQKVQKKTQDRCMRMFIKEAD